MSAEVRGELRVVESSGLEWTLDGGPAGGREALLLEETLARWAEIFRDPAARVLKSNRMRTVVLFDPGSLSASGGSAPGSPGWVLKQYRHADWPDRLRYRWFPARAEREWQALRGLRALGFAAPRPLAYGERRVRGVPLEGGLVMEEIPGATSFLEELRGSLPEGAQGPLTPAASRLLDQAGALARALHERGVDLPDLHPGNLLFSGPPGSRALHVIDLHSARFRRRLSGRNRRAGLAALVHSLSGVAPEGAVRRLLAAYLGLAEGRGAPLERGKEAALERLTRAVLGKAERLERRRRRSRARRAVMPSTGFAVERRPGMRIYRRREFDPAFLKVILSGEARLEILKRGRERTVFIHEGPPDHVIKRRRVSILEALSLPAVSHRLRRAYLAGYVLELSGVDTPRVLALVEEHRFGLMRHATLVTSCVPAPSLDRYLTQQFLGQPPPRGEAARRRHLLFRRLGEAVRRFHEAGVSTRDLSPQNILVLSPAAGAEPPRFCFLDLDSARLGRRPGLRARRRNLIQCGNLPEGHITWTDRLRALRGYAGGDPVFLSRAFCRSLREGLLREAERTLERWLHHASLRESPD